MKKRIAFQLTLLSACLLLAVLAWSRFSAVSPTAATESCNESMGSASGSVETCDKPIWETLPGQIFSAF